MEAREYKHILIGDHDPMSQLLLNMLLSTDYTLTFATDARDVMGHLKTHTPDLIVLDTQLPLMSGLEVCDRIKRVGRLAYVPVVVLLPPEDQWVPDPQGPHLIKADLYVHKPFAGKNVSGRIKALIESGVVAGSQH